MNAQAGAPLWWFAAGLTLTSATQLRIPGAPLGPGEVLLAAWLVATGLMLGWSRRVRGGPALAAIAGFWALAFVALLAGFLPVSRQGYEPTEWSIRHDITSFVFTSAVIVGFVAAGADFERMRRAAALVLGLTVVPLLALYVVALQTPSAGPFDFWYGSRYVGWAANPNQLALAVLAAPFVGLRLAATRKGAARGWAFLVAAGAVVVGLASESDALLISWVTGAAVTLVLVWLRLCRRGFHQLGTAVVAYVLVPVVIVGGAFTAGPTLASEAETTVAAAYRANGQGEDRVRLWGYGVEAIAAAPLFGLGPGSHAGRTAPDGSSEAHNSFIDWGASTGLVGLAAYVALLGWAAVAAIRHGRVALLGGLVALIAFGMFHYVLRQPVYWFYVLAIATLAGHQPAGVAPAAVRYRKARAA